MLTLLCSIFFPGYRIVQIQTTVINCPLDGLPGPIYVGWLGLGLGSSWAGLAWTGLPIRLLVSFEFRFIFLGTNLGGPDVEIAVWPDDDVDPV